MPRGGKRKGAGRPKKEPAKQVRIPVRFIDKVKSFINKLIWDETKNNS